MQVIESLIEDFVKGKKRWPFSEEETPGIMKEAFSYFIDLLTKLLDDVRDPLIGLLGRLKKSSRHYGFVIPYDPWKVAVEFLRPRESLILREKHICSFTIFFVDSEFIRSWTAWYKENLAKTESVNNSNDDSKSKDIIWHTLYSFFAGKDSWGQVCEVNLLSGAYLLDLMFFRKNPELFEAILKALKFTVFTESEVNHRIIRMIKPSVFQEKLRAIGTISELDPQELYKLFSLILNQTNSNLSKKWVTNSNGLFEVKN